MSPRRIEKKLAKGIEQVGNATQEVRVRRAFGPFLFVCLRLLGLFDLLKAVSAPGTCWALGGFWAIKTGEGFEGFDPLPLHQYL